MTEEITSYRPEVVADSDGKWTPNGLRFATEEEALAWAKDLSYRWILVRDYRAMPSGDPVNYKLENGHLTRVVNESVA